MPFYNLSTIAVKISVLVFFLRFTTSKRFQVVALVTTSVVVSAGVLNIVGTSIGCKDLASSCQLTARIYIVTAAVNVATDILILSMPLFILNPLTTMTTRRKIGITLVMMTAGL